MSQEQKLLQRIHDLENQLSLIKQSKKYGLIRESKPELFELESQKMYPVIQEDHELAIISDPEGPQHLIIEGDNYHSLSVLSYTHAGRVDVIYIDPPYNTGNKDFIYNDSYVDKEDSYRHSKWLSFMSKRLKLAKKLLSETGVIFISIDDNEVAQLKLLCDEVFGEANRLGGDSSTNSIIWLKGNSDTASENIAKNHEYILCYRKSTKAKVYQTSTNIYKLKKINEKFFLDKGEIVGFGMLYLNIRPSLGYSIYFNEKTKDFIAVDDYDHEVAKISNDYNEIYKDDIQYIKKGYIPIRPPLSKGRIKCWGVSMSEFNRNLDKYFVKKNNKDRLTVIKLEEVNPNFVSEKDGKYYYSISKMSPISSYTDIATSSEGSEELNNIFEISKLFNNPKPRALISNLLKAFSKTSIILDFFAGSGTTAHAVMKLNEEDDGSRQCILCSSTEATSDNPDKNICRDITYERNKRVIQGYTTPKGEHILGIPANLRYFTTKFISKIPSIDDLRMQFVQRCDDLLRVKENTFDQVDTNLTSTKHYTNGHKSTFICYDIHEFGQFLSLLDSCADEKVVYIFALSKEVYEEEIAQIDKNIVVQNIPDDLLMTYFNIFHRA